MMRSIFMYRRALASFRLPRRMIRASSASLFAPRSRFLLPANAVQRFFSSGEEEAPQPKEEIFDPKGLYFQLKGLIQENPDAVLGEYKKLRDKKLTNLYHLRLILNNLIQRKRTDEIQGLFEENSDMRAWDTYISSLKHGEEWELLSKLAPRIPEDMLSQIEPRNMVSLVSSLRSGKDNLEKLRNLYSKYKPTAKTVKPVISTFAFAFAFQDDRNQVLEVLENVAELASKGLDVDLFAVHKAVLNGMKNHEPEAVLDFFDNYLRANELVTHQHYGVLLRILLERHDAVNVRKYLNQMKEDGFEIEMKQWQTLMEVLLKRDYEAVKLLLNIIPHSKLLATVLLHLAKKDKSQFPVFLSEFSKIPHNSLCITAIISASETLEEALKHYHSLLERGLRPLNLTYLYLFDKAIAEKNSKALIDLLKDIKQFKHLLSPREVSLVTPHVSQAQLMEIGLEVKDGTFAFSN